MPERIGFPGSARMAITNAILVASHQDRAPFLADINIGSDPAHLVARYDEIFRRIEQNRAHYGDGTGLLRTLLSELRFGKEDGERLKDWIDTHAHDDPLPIASVSSPHTTDGVVLRIRHYGDVFSDRLSLLDWVETQGKEHRMCAGAERVFNTALSISRTDGKNRPHLSLKGKAFVVVGAAQSFGIDQLLESGAAVLLIDNSAKKLKGFLDRAGENGWDLSVAEADILSQPIESTIRHWAKTREIEKFVLALLAYFQGFEIPLVATQIATAMRLQDVTELVFQQRSPTAPYTVTNPLAAAARIRFKDMETGGRRMSRFFGTAGVFLANNLMKTRLPHRPYLPNYPDELNETTPRVTNPAIGMQGLAYLVAQYLKTLYGGFNPVFPVMMTYSLYDHPVISRLLGAAKPYGVDAWHPAHARDLSLFFIGGALALADQGTRWGTINSPLFDGGVASNPYQLASLGLPTYLDGRKLPRRREGEEIPESVEQEYLFA